MAKSRYCTFQEFTEALGLSNVQRVYEWAGKGHLDVVSIDGIMMLKQKYAEKFVKDWKRSCPPIEAARLIGVSERGGSMPHLIDREVVEAIKVCGRNRILLRSIESAKVYVAGIRERQREAGSILGKSGSGHRWTGKETNVHRFTSKEARKVAKKMWKTRKLGKVTVKPLPPTPPPLELKQVKLKVQLTPKPSPKSVPSTDMPMQVYRPRGLAEREQIGTKRLTTAEEVVRFLGEQVDLSVIRSEQVGDQILYYVHSVESYSASFRRSPA